MSQQTTLPCVSQNHTGHQQKGIKVPYSWTMPPSVWTITLNSAAGSRYRTVVLQTCFTNSSISQQQFLALSRSLKFRSLTWEAVQQMQCAWYLVCTNHRCSILSFTRCVQRVYCAWCGRILKARLPSLALSSRSPNPGVRNKASTPVTVAGIFTTLLSAHNKKRCEQCKCKFPSKRSISVCGFWLSCCCLMISSRMFLGTQKNYPCRGSWYIRLIKAHN